MGKEERAKFGPYGKQHPLLEPAIGTQLETDPMVVGGMNELRRGKREEGGEPMSKPFDSAWVWRTSGMTRIGTGRTGFARPISQA